MTKTDLYSRLNAAGYLNLADWARNHGHQPGTVRQVIARYLNSKNPRPGQSVRAMLEQLSKTIGVPLIAYDPEEEKWQERKAHIAALSPLVSDISKTSHSTLYARAPSAVWRGLARHFGGRVQADLYPGDLEAQRQHLEQDLERTRKAAVREAPIVADRAKIKAEIATLRARQIAGDQPV